MWDITRTKPDGNFSGKAIPIFINNLQQHYTKISAFGDGAIDVWGFLDLQLFDKKLSTGWVCTNPPTDSRLSVFNLGIATVANGEWSRTVPEIRETVWEVVRSFDPELSNVINMDGSNTTTDGKVRRAKMGLSDASPYRIDDAGNQILGDEVPLFEVDGKDRRLQQWFIFSDQTSRVGFNGDLVSFDDVCGRIENGELTVSANEARWVEIPTLGRFRPKEGIWSVSSDQRILEAHDISAKLKGDKGAIQRCMEAFRMYNELPNDDNRFALRTAYDSVPDHLKMYCGNMDSKDWPIRRILKPVDGE